MAATQEEHLQQGDASKANGYIRAFQFCARLLFLLFFRVRVIGKQNVPSTPVLFCANHLGWADVFVILLFLPAEPRIYVMGEQEVKSISKFRRRIIDSLGVFVMLDRTKPMQALRTMGDVLKRGGSILLFPEGQLGTREGELQELQQGAAHTAISTGVPLLPVGLTGTGELWFRRKIIVRIGQPIPPPESTAGTREKMHTMTHSLDTAMRALLPGDKQHARIKLLRRWLTKLL